MQRCEVRDVLTLSSRTITPAGFLVAPGTSARAGNVQQYRAAELKLDGEPPERVVRLYRPPEEVFAPDTVKSFDGAPITHGHPAEGFVTAKNWRALSVGDITKVASCGSALSGELNVRDADAVAAVMAHDTDQLSCGYTFDFDPTPGTSPSGEVYDGIQRNIRGNHIAIVRAARGGDACCVADNDPTKEHRMSTRKLAVDSVSYDLDEQAASLVESLVKTRDAALSDLAGLQTSTRTELTAKDGEITSLTERLTKLVADSAKEVSAAQAKVPTAEQIDLLVAERSKVVGDAKQLSPELKVEGKTNHQVRITAIGDAAAKSATAKVMVDAVFGADGIDKADESTVRATFSALVASTAQDAAARAAGDEAVSNALLGKKTGADSAAAGPKMSGRDEWIAKQQYK